MSPYITTKHFQRSLGRRNTREQTMRLTVNLNVLFSILAALAILGYAFLLNILVTRSYHLTQLEQRLSALAQVHEKLQRDLTDLRSSESLSAHLLSLGLVAATHQLAYPEANTAVALSSPSAVE